MTRFGSAPLRRSRRNSRRMSQQRHRFLSLELLEARLCLSLSVPALSSLPGANHTIYLDFDGHLTEGTSWNSYFNNPSINSPAFDIDGNSTSFSAVELTRIENTWKRVSEDFIPFNVNVTTVEPSIDALRKSGSTDTQWGVRAVITKDNVGCGCGGIAYIGSFNWSSDTPVFIYNTSEKGVSEATSHEVGHSLYLSHDGTSTAEYYAGHGSGETSWAPIMGVSYNSNVTQWDRGEYFGSNNAGTSANLGKGPDDLAIITGYNGFTYRADDHANTAATATPLTVAAAGVSGSGIIERTGDVDVFSFTTGSGSVTLDIRPFELGANLDIRADLYDANGSLLVSANSAATLSASITAQLSAGQYFVHITGAGVGDPTTSPPTGYTGYASLGRYTVQGTVGVSQNDYVSIAAVDAVKSEGQAGSTAFTFKVLRTGDVGFATSVDYAVSGSGSSAADAEDFASGALPHGTIAFAAGETSQIITIDVRGDTINEPDESFTVTLVNPTGNTQISVSQAAGTILNDDSAPSLTITALDAQKVEGTSGTPTPFTFIVTRNGSSSSTASVAYSVTGIGGKSAAGPDDFAGGAYPSGVVTFAAGETSKSIVISVAADSVEERNESFRVALKNASGATIATAYADGTILNDDKKSSGKDTGGNGNSGKGGGNSKAHEEHEHSELEHFLEWNEHAEWDDAEPHADPLEYFEPPAVLAASSQGSAAESAGGLLNLVPPLEMNWWASKMDDTQLRPVLSDVLGIDAAFTFANTRPSLHTDLAAGPGFTAVSKVYEAMGDDYGFASHNDHDRLPSAATVGEALEGTLVDQLFADELSDLI